MFIKRIYLLFFSSILQAAAPLSKIAYNNNFNPLPLDYRSQEKDVTVILYMAADNDLRSFGYRNLEEIKYLLKTTNATDNFNIFIHLDVHNPGQRKMTLHLVGYQKELCLAWQGEMDSGKEETLIFTYSEAMRYCPGKKIVLGLWNHGTGDLNPTIGRICSTSSLYEFDPIENKIVLNRTIGFLDYIENFHPSDDRGICFDDSTHNYLTNQKVGNALEKICTTFRGGRKIDLLFCDACLMSGVGFIKEIKPWVHYFIASEEVVLATGFRYEQVLNFFNQPYPNIKDFIKHTVRIFENTYQKLTPDYTLSGIDLNMLDPLYTTINDISEILIIGLKNQKNKSVKEFIKKSGARTQCTSFDEPTYKDLKHLFLNFLKNISMIQLNNTDLEYTMQKTLREKITIGLAQLQTSVVAHCSGKNLLQSGGVSIYLPETRMHGSFQHTTFAKTNLWFPMIKLYLES